MDIETITPQQEESLGAMSIEQLEAQVASEEGAAPVEGQATGQPQAQGEAVGKQTTDAPKEDGPPKWFQDYAENMKRELGSFRSLASLKDQMPKLIQQQLSAELAKLQQAQRNANLSPEDQEAQAQLQTQQDALKQFVREQAGEVLGEQGKEYIEILSELKEQRQDFSHRNNTLELVKEFIPEGADKAWDGLFEQSYKDITAGKEGAVERQERLEKDPAYAALQLVQFQRSQVQGQAQQVTQQRSNAAKQAAQGVKTGGAPTQAKKSLAEMSQAEMEAEADKDLAAFEAAIPEQSR